MITISENIYLADNEIEIQAIRAQGAGGQNVNKVSSAIHLRFNIHTSSLPFHIKSRLLHLRDRRISREGILILKAQEHRTQEKNKQEAKQRLIKIIQSVIQAPKYRVATKPKKSSIRKRLDSKVKKGKLKTLRSKVSDY